VTSIWNRTDSVAKCEASAVCGVGGVDIWEAPNIGVFLCRCEGCISNSVDLDDVRRQVADLDDVKLVEIDDRLCSTESLRRMRKTVEAKKLQKVVIGACSPRLYSEDFQSALEHVGLKRHLVEMANLREQCAWIHSRDKGAATAKAADAVAVAVANVRVADPKRGGCEAVVSTSICDGCGICVSVCRTQAIEMVEDPLRKGKLIAVIDPRTCDACGACVSSCPSGAMDQGRFSNEQILAQIDVVTGEKDPETVPNPKVLVFTCHWCSYAAADIAGIKRLEMHPNFLVVRTLCSARVDPEWILKAFSRGIDGVLVLAGTPGECHYEVGNLRTRKRIGLLKRMISQLGFREERLMLGYVDSDEPEEFQKKVNSFVDLIFELGPNPLRTPPSLGNEASSARETRRGKSDIR
jgi:coenzyme F420-reducing hydrogenase delta subunit/ferredoxin